MPQARGQLVIPARHNLFPTPRNLARIAADKPTMSRLGYHVMCRLRDGGVIAPSRPERLLAARVVLAGGRAFKLLAFHLADSHLHLQVAASHRESSELARRIAIGLSHALRLPISFAPAHLKPIEDQQHNYRVFDYIFRQQLRHGLSDDPHAEGSNLPDLLGLRTIGAHTAAHVRQLLPRVGRRHLVEHLGRERLDPAIGAPTTDLEAIVEAASASIGLCRLAGRSDAVRMARTAAIKIARPIAGTKPLADALDVHPRTVERLRSHAVDRRVEQAIRLQLALRATDPCPRRSDTAATLHVDQSFTPQEDR